MPRRPLRRDNQKVEFQEERKKGGNPSPVSLKSPLHLRGNHRRGGKGREREGGREREREEIETRSPAAPWFDRRERTSNQSDGIRLTLTDRNVPSAERLDSQLWPWTGSRTSRMESRTHSSGRRVHGGDFRCVWVQVGKGGMDGMAWSGRVVPNRKRLVSRCTFPPSFLARTHHHARCLDTGQPDHRSLRDSKLGMVGRKAVPYRQ
ncbi:hypothetical protein IE53DRAFT_102482 [Violaceomyces palustris]|uniref:Uncharacterized protein n=1 Tax=Violaceomyces palustris TaxID=1673888 RepID=A0ACD0NWY2_9BASI|nr:hypothetical protein IE53DRAFT_102482 [Violaceomyces palustris]